jgi:hypothetical protein
MASSTARDQNRRFNAPGDLCEKAFETSCPKGNTFQALRSLTMSLTELSFRGELRAFGSDGDDVLRLLSTSVPIGDPCDRIMDVDTHYQLWTNTHSYVRNLTDATMAMRPSGQVTKSVAV